MSIATFAGGEATLAEQDMTTAKDKVPRRRQTVARADLVSQPEAR